MTPEQRPTAPNTQEEVVNHSGKAGYEYPLDRHNDGKELHEVADDLAPADTRNLEPTTEELELIRLHREGRLQMPTVAEPTPEPIVLPDVSALTAGNKSNKPEKSTGTNPNRKRLLIGGSAVALLATGAALVAGIAKGPNDPEGKTVPTSVPVATATPSFEATPSATPSAIETEAVTGTVFEQKTTVEAMDAMPIEQFAKLPYADRLAFSLAKVPNLATNLASGEEFVKDDPRYITGGFWQLIRMDALAAEDPIEGSKIYSGMQLYTTRLNTGEVSPEFTKTVEGLRASGGGVSLTEDMVYETNGDWQTGVDREGHPIEFTNLTHTLINRRGETVPDSQATSQVIKVTVKTLDGTLHTAFPQGYTAKGKVSPEDKYPY